MAFYSEDVVWFEYVSLSAIVCVEIICIYEENKIYYEFDCCAGDSVFAFAAKL